jgi:hypothetical protein
MNFEKYRNNAYMHANKKINMILCDLVCASEQPINSNNDHIDNRDDDDDDDDYTLSDEGNYEMIGKDQGTYDI